jgi:hypothetical protein
LVCIAPLGKRAPAEALSFLETSPALYSPEHGEG